MHYDEEMKQLFH